MVTIPHEAVDFNKANEANDLDDHCASHQLHEQVEGWSGHKVNLTDDKRFKFGRESRQEGVIQCGASGRVHAIVCGSSEAGKEQSTVSLLTISMSEEHVA